MRTQVVYSQENLTGNHNSILLTIYIKFHGLCYNFSMPTLIFMPYPHVHYLSASCPITYSPCIYLKASMPYTYALMLYSLIFIDHVYTICIPWETYVPWYHSVSRPFPILLDPKSFQTTLGLWHDVMWLESHMPSLSHCRLIITTTIS